MDKKTITIIIPIFNEEKNIPVLFSRLEKVRNLIQNLKFRYLFINDGSNDKSLDILTEISFNNSFVSIISFTRNFGHQNALSCGLEHSDSDYVVTIDSDLQDPPELIIEMYNLITNDFDVVYAQRKKRDGESLFKLISAKLFYKIINNLCDLKIPPNTGDYRLITKRVLTEFKKYKEKHKFIRGLIPWLGFKSAPVFFNREKRFSGKSKYNLSRMLNFAFDAIFSFSIKPIEYISRIGFFLIIISSFYGLFILYKKIILNEVIPGFTPIFLAIIFFGGFNLLFLGIIGHYVAKIFEQTKNRPNYIVDKKINIKD